jgi:hypothetical protein
MAAVDRDVEQQLAENEAILRNVNEAIERGHWPGENQAPVAFRCECAELGCSRMLELMIDEYERVRGNARWFVIAPGHPVRELEVVVERHDDYLIVEKRDEAGRIAEVSDPRG